MSCNKKLITLASYIMKTCIHVSTLKPLYYGHFGALSLVLILQRFPQFRGHLIHQVLHWDTEWCPHYRGSTFQRFAIERFHCNYNHRSNNTFTGLLHQLTPFLGMNSQQSHLRICMVLDVYLIYKICIQYCKYCTIFLPFFSIIYIFSSAACTHTLICVVTCYLCPRSHS